jgi:chromosome segregation ATPase
MIQSSNGDDIFAKVKGLIKDMIEKLLDEAAADASHKAYCDKEMSETKAKKEELSTEIAALTTKIDMMTARSALIKQEVATLQKELADLSKTQSEMDRIRAEEKAAYEPFKPASNSGLLDS